MQLKDVRINELLGMRVLSKREVGAVNRLPLVPALYTGVEIEAEHVAWRNREARDNIVTNGWTAHHDNSLRDDGMEFVLDAPKCGEELSHALQSFCNVWADGGVSFGGSPRSGTHIHVNMTDRTVGHLQALAALVYALEPLIFKLAGEDRQWCSYANSLNTVHSSALRSLLAARDRESYGWYEVWPNSDGDRYYGCNITSMAKYGTVEFRYFPTPSTPEQLWTWLDLCQALWLMASQFENEEDPAKAVLFRILNERGKFFVDMEQAGLSSLTNGTWYPTVQEQAEELLEIISVVYADGRDNETAVSWSEFVTLTSQQARPVRPSTRAFPPLPAPPTTHAGEVFSRPVWVDDAQCVYDSMVVSTPRQGVN